MVDLLVETLVERSAIRDVRQRVGLGRECQVGEVGEDSGDRTSQAGGKAGGKCQRDRCREEKASPVGAEARLHRRYGLDGDERGAARVELRVLCEERHLAELDVTLLDVR